ncbi:MAG: exodeoxyribonuclease VII large subunit [Erysipelotrichaceae bacterium]|nr:exodeoxyribonuclease VII large subunit [Erysipelotrichaceae bacterium]
MNNDKYLSISALTRYLKYKFDSDDNLRQIFLKGEISNLKIHSTGHLYFSLKDENSKINAIMFSTNARRLTFKPVEGTNVLVVGRVSIYEQTGNYQIYVDDMQEDGVGNLYVQYEKLKAELAKEGLFDQSKKKKIPKMPSRIGIITAPTGAAIRDILSTIKRRFPLTETYLFPALVQGENAAPDIVKKLKQADNFGVDLIILGRGGGSIEDLWAFNEEIVARAIYEAKTPIISAVGHEVDFTIADFVADLRAPTPTGAAEMAVVNRTDVINELNHLKIRLNEALLSKVNVLKIALENIKSNYILNNPVIMYENKKQVVDNLLEKIKTLIYYKITNYNLKLDHLKKSYILNHPEELYKKKSLKLDKIITSLELLNPLSVLKRGYTLTYKNDKVVRNIKDLKVDDIITIKFKEGTVKANIKEIGE